MSKLIDLTGQKFAKLTVIKRAENAKNGNVRWECVCECGNKTIVTGGNLKSGTVKSCGCLKKIPSNIKHKESKTPLYRKWKSMLYRCENPKHQAYKDYGARGITVCEEWHDFLAFKRWVEKTKPNGNLSIDRIDNDKGYCPNNCRWVSEKEQANNRRSNVMIAYQGEIHNLLEWSDILGFNYKSVHNRMHKLGWTFERAISTPIDIKKRNKVERNKNG